MESARRAIAEKIRNAVPTHSCLIAVSGGQDSMALLDLVAKVLQSIEVRAKVGIIHVDHSLRPDSSNQALWLQEYCKERYKNFSFHSCTLNKPMKMRTSVEEWARDMRYREITRVCKEFAYTFVMTAHHFEDQLETMWMRMLEGKELYTWRSMQMNSFRPNYEIFRPLLYLYKEQLTKYVKKNQLAFVEDESNYDLQYRRNLLRHKIIPYLQTTWPLSLDKVQVQILKMSQETQELLEELNKEYLDLPIYWFGVELEIPQGALSLQLRHLFRNIKAKLGFGLRREVIAEICRQRQKCKENSWWKVNDQEGVWCGRAFKGKEFAWFLLSQSETKQKLSLKELENGKKIWMGWNVELIEQRSTNEPSLVQESWAEVFRGFEMGELFLPWVHENCFLVTMGAVKNSQRQKFLSSLYWPSLLRLMIPCILDADGKIYDLEKEKKSCKRYLHLKRRETESCGT